jgi:hypothetical protein
MYASSASSVPLSLFFAVHSTFLFMRSAFRVSLVPLGQPGALSCPTPEPPTDSGPDRHQAPQEEGREEAARQEWLRRIVLNVQIHGQFIAADEQHDYEEIYFIECELSFRYSSCSYSFRTIGLHRNKNKNYIKLNIINKNCNRPANFSK